MSDQCGIVGHFHFHFGGISNPVVPIYELKLNLKKNLTNNIVINKTIFSLFQWPIKMRVGIDFYVY